MLEFDNGSGCLTGHVVNGVLVTKPIRTLDGIVHVPSPVILVHVSESSIDTTLSSDGVRSSREELGDTGSVEASLGKTESSSQTGTTGTDNESIVLVVLEGGQLGVLRLVGDDLTYNDGVLVAHEG